MGWLGEPISLGTLVLPSLLIVIGSSYATHVVARYYLELETPTGSEHPVHRALRQAGLPVFISGLATVDRILGPAAELDPGRARARTLRGDRHHVLVRVGDDAGAGADRRDAGTTLPARRGGRRRERRARPRARGARAVRHPPPPHHLHRRGGAGRAVDHGAARASRPTPTSSRTFRTTRRSGSRTPRSARASPARCRSTSSWAPASRSR